MSENLNLPLLDLPLFDASSTEFLAGEQIVEATLLGIEEARERIWGCYFLVAVGVDQDPHQRVRDVCDALVRASQRGVDVRLLCDEFESSFDGLPSNEIAVHFLNQQGVAARTYRNDRHHSTHSKYLLIDDKAQIVGSGNLTHGGLYANLEMAVRVESPDLLRWLGERFLRNWDESPESEPLA
ncbi:MAG: phosphatidylserine/phosphatidylglycerophosphate/cardiolipin synthase-like enzyme [Planctomycetaceae bacterium]|jgi:phosphatidylserine/phosphatidylglycerophosphate/cardiolipin synthase-like enzyme